MDYKGLTLDKFQEEAIGSIERNHSVIVSAPTGSGKTLIADYIINKYVSKGIKVIYTAPIKALSNQKYKEFSADYGVEKVGLLTGDVVRNPAAPVLIMTTEIYRNMVLTQEKAIDSVSYVIFDEIHYINDIERGYVWEESIIFSPEHVRFLCLSATIPNANEFSDWIHSIKCHNVDVIVHEKRSVPLEMHFYDTELGVTTLEDIKEINDIPEYGRAMGNRRKRSGFMRAPSHVELVKEIREKLPCFFFCFSRRKCEDNATELAKSRLFQQNIEVSAVVRAKFSSLSPEISKLKSAASLRKVLPFGIGFHHAGLIPAMKELVEELFSKGLLKVLYTTETFAVGINMPAKTVCFESLRKFDGMNFRFLNSKEYFQIAGRAGRRGIDRIGHTYAMIQRRDFDYYILKKITAKDTEPIRSQFRLSVNTSLNLIKRHSAPEIEKILKMNFYTFQRLASAKPTTIKANFDNLSRKLELLGYTSCGSLTAKGEFSSKIYSDEILEGEVFGTDFWRSLNEYQILVLIACLCFEEREKTEFFTLYPSKWTKELRQRINEHEYLRREKRFSQIENLTALVHPCYHGKTIFEIISNTNLLEGDIIRFLRQVLDRLGQIREATEDHQLRNLTDSCSHLIKDCIKDVDDEGEKSA